MENEMRSGEYLFKKVKGDTWKMPGSMIGQISGEFIVTNQRIMFHSWRPFKNTADYNIEYKHIKSIKPYNINLFLRTGIQIITDANKEYKISVKKRKKYIAYMSEFTL